MIYAPVIIPTLNRYDHLKNLIDSLRRNKFAEYTELYIGVDYPPSKKYEDGYKKVCQYLGMGISGFAKVTIIKREYNYGEGKNLRDLRERVFQKYDRYIMTEDDNVFSANFLEYMDRALEIYEHDPKIRRICGYSYSFGYDSPSHNVLAMPVANAWGYGAWKNKIMEDLGKTTTSYYKHALRNFFKVCYCIRANADSVNYVFSCILNGREVVYGDYKMSAYYNLNRYYSLAPVETMVHNCGYDGSGLHCTSDSKFDFVNSRPLHSGENFIPDEKYSVWTAEDMKKFNLQQGVTRKRKIRLYILSFLYMIFGERCLMLLLRCVKSIRAVLKKVAHE